MNNNMNLVTSCNFREREYLINLKTMRQSEILEVKVADKKTAEEWLGSYNASYIENLTHKTGNFKKFDTFVSMLKAGLLSTSHCVSLDLLKFEDLEMLRSRSSQSRNFNIPVHNSQILAPSANNRRYLIVTYSVEFDRIHYPLALEYCGPPDPRVLQETIQRLEKQITDLQFQLENNDWSHVRSEVDVLQKKVVDVSTENIMLKQEIKKLRNLCTNKDCNKEVDTLLRYTYALENKLQFEKNALEKLKKENYQLLSKLEESQQNEKWLQNQLDLNVSSLCINNTRLKERVATKNRSVSPKRDLCTEKQKVGCAEKPFSRHRSMSKERKVKSARNCGNVIHSSSEESTIYNKGRFILMGPTTPPRSRASSPSLSDFSHNSENSSCACRNCLNRRFIRKDLSINAKTKEKGRGRAKLLRRIQSLEELINGIVPK